MDDDSSHCLNVEEFFTGLKDYGVVLRKQVDSFRVIVPPLGILVWWCPLLTRLQRGRIMVLV